MPSFSLVPTHAFSSFRPRLGHICESKVNTPDTLDVSHTFYTRHHIRFKLDREIIDGSLQRRIKELRDKIA